MAVRCGEYGKRKGKAGREGAGLEQSSRMAELGRRVTRSESQWCPLQDQKTSHHVSYSDLRDCERDSGLFLLRQTPLATTVWLPAPSTHTSILVYSSCHFFHLYNPCSFQSCLAPEGQEIWGTQLMVDHPAGATLLSTSRVMMCIPTL